MDSKKSSSSILSSSVVGSPEEAGIYLDYAATTPMDPGVASVMNNFLTIDGVFGNPASINHRFGRAAAEAVEHARSEVAALLFSKPEEIVWTSGATESINLALKGGAYARGKNGNHIVISSMEHKAVLDSAAWLESQGFEISRVEPDDRGLITPKTLSKVLRSDTILVSLTFINNETGVITDIESLGPIISEREVLLHVDAVQGAARLSLDTIANHADLISISGHKMYGPKGIGALRVRSSLRSELVPQIHGGGQEFGLRSGTLPTHQIVGMGEAARIVRYNSEQDLAHVTDLDQRLCAHIDQIEGAVPNVDSHCRVPGILNVYFADVEAESLMISLGNIAISPGSACTSASTKPSHVLQALGYSSERALSSVRFSFGRFTTMEEIEHVGSLVGEMVNVLRKISR